MFEQILYVLVQLCWRTEKSFVRVMGSGSAVFAEVLTKLASIDRPNLEKVISG